jgi:hypothetical protein
MFDYYQVERITAEFMPYKYELVSSTTGVNDCTARPIYSCIDPETSAPETPSGMASYGNIKVTEPYKPHQRSLCYHSLGIQK